MPYSTPRIQVLLRQEARDKVVEFAEAQGLNNSKACSQLIEEALRARGLLPPLPSEVPSGGTPLHGPERNVTSTSPMAAATDVTASTSEQSLPGGVDRVMPKEWKRQTVERRVEPLAAEDAETLKLRLMAEMWEKLKGM